MLNILRDTSVHVSRCLFYVAELLGEIKKDSSVTGKEKNVFSLSTNDAKKIPITTPNGISNFTKLVNGYIPAEMKKTFSCSGYKMAQKGRSDAGSHERRWS